LQMPANGRLEEDWSQMGGGGRTPPPPSLSERSSGQSGLMDGLSAYERGSKSPPLADTTSSDRERRGSSTLRRAWGTGRRYSFDYRPSVRYYRGTRMSLRSRPNDFAHGDGEMVCMLDGEDLLHTDPAARASFAPLLDFGIRLLQFGSVLPPAGSIYYAGVSRNWSRLLSWHSSPAPQRRCAASSTSAATC